MAAAPKTVASFSAYGGTAVSYDVSVAALNTGGFALAWIPTGGGVAAEIFGAANTAPDGPLTVFGAGAVTRETDVAALTDGTFVVAWTFNNQGADEVIGYRYTATGAQLGSLIPFAFDGSDNAQPSITAQPQGNYLVGFTQEGIAVRFVQNRADGTVVSGPDLVDQAAPTGATTDPAAATLVNGAYVVAYERSGEIYQRPLVQNVAATQVNPATAGTHTDPAIAALEGGGYVVAWNDAHAHVAGQRYDASDAKAGGSLFLSPAVPSHSVGTHAPSLVGLVGGGFLTVWDGSDGLQAQARDADGNTASAIVQLTAAGHDGSIGQVDAAQKKNGDIVVVWSAAAPAPGGVTGKVIRIMNEVDGTHGNDRGGKALEGGVSKLHPGFQANDELHGKAGNDVLQGFGGAEDFLDGGKGHDTASYRDATGGVKASLAKPAGNSGDARGDVYHSIENLDGSAFADRLTGNGNANHLLGRGGDDVLIGKRGGDVLDGGEGADKLYAGKGDARDVFVFGKGASDNTDPDRIFGFDARAGHEAVSDKIDLSHLHAAWGDIDLAQHGKSVTVSIDYKGGGKPDMVIEVMKVDELHKSDFIL